MNAKNHEQMDIWNLAMEVVTDIYRLTNAFPATERFVLCQQMRRAAVSVPSNIAEGAARQSPKEFINFLFIALGSLSELETQLELSVRLGFTMKNEDICSKIIRIRQMGAALIRRLKA